LKSTQDIISEIIRVEGLSYTNNPSDLGGPTKGGITLETLTRWRQKPCTAADVENLTEAEIRLIYHNKYIVQPKFDLVRQITEPVAVELIDTGVNMGPEVAAQFLQRILNAFNKQGTLYPDLAVDGSIGDQTLEALRAYVRNRLSPGVDVLLKALNCMQGERYIMLAEKREKNEDFVYGWIKERVAL
jgi:lysozyme family protein